MTAPRELANTRRALGLSQRHVADALREHPRTISRLEHDDLDGIAPDLITRYQAYLDTLATRPGTPAPPSTHPGPTGTDPTGTQDHDPHHPAVLR